MSTDGWDDGLSSFYAVAARHDGDHRVTTWIPVRGDLTDGHGRLRFAALAFGVDCAVGISAGWTSMPDWVVTTDLDLRILGPATVGPLRAQATPVRRGRGQVLIEARLVDEGAGDRPVAVATANHTILPADSGAPIAVMPVGFVHRQPGPIEPVAPLPDHFGVRAIAPGVVDLVLAAHT
jgi:acyl-coenzyme A thioesterase PaaI-like protein